jgi:hypothetical protein
VAAWTPSQLALNVQVTGNMLGLFLGGSSAAEQEGQHLEEQYGLVKEVLMCDLPQGWQRTLDSEGKVYYFNFDDNVTQWEHPLLFKFQQRVVRVLSDRSPASPEQDDIHSKSRSRRSSDKKGKKKKKKKKKQDAPEEAKKRAPQLMERRSAEYVGERARVDGDTLLKTYTDPVAARNRLNEEAYHTVPTVEMYSSNVGKSSSRRVQEAIRTRLGELVRTKDRCDKTSSKLASSVAHIRMAVDQLHGIKAKSLAAATATEGRIKSLHDLACQANTSMGSKNDHPQEQKGRQHFADDSIAESLLSCLAKELLHWRELVSNLQKLVLYGGECQSYQKNLQSRFALEVDHVEALLSLERRCLAVDSKSSSTLWASSSKISSKKSAHKRQSVDLDANVAASASVKRLHSVVEQKGALAADKMSLAQLEGHLGGALEVGEDFLRRHKQLLAETASDTGMRRRQVLVAARNTVRQSFQLCEHIQTDVLGNQRAMRLMQHKEQDLKAALQQTLQPLIVCQRRYEMHMTAFQTTQASLAFGVDGSSIEVELVHELKGLQLQVSQLKQQLESIRRELGLLADVQTQLDAQLAYEHTIMRFASACLTRLGLGSGADAREKADKNLALLSFQQSFSSTPMASPRRPARSSSARKKCSPKKNSPTKRSSTATKSKTPRARRCPDSKQKMASMTKRIQRVYG